MQKLQRAEKSLQDCEQRDGPLLAPHLVAQPRETIEHLLPLIDELLEEPIP